MHSPYCQTRALGTVGKFAAGLVLVRVAMALNSCEGSRSRRSCLFLGVATVGAIARDGFDSGLVITVL